VNGCLCERVFGSMSFGSIGGWVNGCMCDWVIGWIGKLVVGGMMIWRMSGSVSG